MTEQQCQSKIIKAWEKLGGKVVNGVYTKSGEHDLQGGYPIYEQLHYLSVEVKNEWEYNKVMSNLVLQDDSTYRILDPKKFDKRTHMQVAKLNETRLKGGLACFAWNIDQVIDYVEGEDR